MEQQKHDIVVCIPKTGIPTTTTDYRPIILLNTGYKILARIIANRLRYATPDPILCHARQHDFRRSGDSTGRCSLCGIETRLTTHSFFEIHSSFWRDFSYLSPSNAKKYGYSMKFILLLLLLLSFIMSLFSNLTLVQFIYSVK
jgi:hypothetical protein